MKIVFESREEKEQFIEAGCPHDIPTVFESKYCGVYDYNEARCKECWENSGVVLEVDDDPGDPDFDYEKE